MSIILRPKSGLKGTFTVPGDKSISHRAIMLGAIAEGDTVIEGLLKGDDCLRTMDCFKTLGIEIADIDAHKIVVKGKGLHGLGNPTNILYVGNSGTTIRLMSGILAGQNFHAVITGDESIQQRPMQRIIEPLRKMGAKITAKDDNFAPMTIGSVGRVAGPMAVGPALTGIEYKLPIPSAQIKSCLLLATLYAKGKTTISEPSPSRDHTERMLELFKVKLTRSDNKIFLEGGQQPQASWVIVPGDISSAAYLMAAGLLCPDSKITIENVGTNPTRTGILDVLEKMGADIKKIKEETISNEPRANLEIQTSKLKAVEIGGDLIPRLIDEIPILAVIATQAEGTTRIKDAKELRVKESDRVKTVVEMLKKFGANVEEKEDGMLISGPTPLKGAVIDSAKDHRIAMAAAIAGLIAEGETVVENTECIKTSFPNFEELLSKL